MVEGWAREEFDDEKCPGDVDPTAYIIATCNPLTGEPLQEPSMLLTHPEKVMRAGSVGPKEAFATQVTMLAKATKAIGVVLVMAGWVAEGDAAERAMKTGSVAKDPARVRSAIVTYEHTASPSGTHVRIAKALPNGKLGEWVEFPISDGRFTLLSHVWS
jgi:hypothetical protein